MKTVTVPIILAGLMVPAAIAGAKPEAGSPGKTPEARSAAGTGDDGDGRRKGGPGRGWKSADKDGSGSLSREEFDAMPRLRRLPEDKRSKIFGRLDKNNDGVLGGAELKAVMRRPHEGGKEAIRRFRELDTDKSGGVSLAELKAGDLFKKLQLEKQEALFARLDTDKDGEITVKDRPQGPRGDGRPPNRPGKRGDARRDADGKDVRPQGNPRGMIRALDENKDGSVSFGEFRKGPAVRDLGEDAQEDRFEARDKNGDRKIDEADFPDVPGGGGKDLPEGKKAGQKPAPSTGG